MEIFSARRGRPNGKIELWFYPLLLVTGFAAATLLGGCAVVPQNHRAHFADPVLRDADDSLDAHRKRKLYTTREAAAGGDGKPAGGGCSCQ